MRKYKHNYDEFRDCFADHADVITDLIYGDTGYIKSPFISYVIPAYGRADLLKRTLNSVLSQQPAECEWDVVVVDNDPQRDNETERVIREIDNPKILYYKNRVNIGVDGNYNRCIETARGKWVAMLHADDLIMNDHLKEMYRLLTTGKILSAKRPAAYICQRYIEFSDESKVELDREKAIQTNNTYSWNLKQIYNNGNLELLTQNYALMTGFYAALPSFGTLMNREIMLKEGGFDKELGICEDIITPYRLGEKYSVYMAPMFMGYYRFNNNESMKSSTILKIYESMLDFREYVYSRNWITSLWGNIARDLHSKNLRNYCIGLSRFSERKLCVEDFKDIYEVKRLSKLKMFIFKIGISIFNKKHQLSGYDENISNLFESRYYAIQAAVERNSNIIIYGAGSVAEVIIPLIKKMFSASDIVCCAVTSIENNKRKICGLNIKCINELAENYCECTVVTATEIWEYQSEMNDTLAELGFKNVVNLLN